MPLPSSPWYTFCPLIDSYYDELRHSLDSTTHILTNRQPIVSSMIPRAHANGCGKPPRNRDREACPRRREASPLRSQNHPRGAYRGSPRLTIVPVRTCIHTYARIPMDSYVRTHTGSGNSSVQSQSMSTSPHAQHRARRRPPRAPNLELWTRHSSAGCGLLAGRRKAHAIPPVHAREPHFPRNMNGMKSAVRTACTI